MKSFVNDKALDYESPSSPLIFNEISTPHLREKLTLERKEQDPMRFYEVHAILGGGSMGSVSKVKKRKDALGGSARPGFFGSAEGNILSKLFRCFNFGCCDPEEDLDSSEAIRNSKDIFYKAQPSTSSVESKSSNRKENQFSSMIRFAHHDTFYALKSIHLNQARDEILRKELRNEVEILKTLDHPNVVRPVETFDYKNSLYLVLELCSGGDLYTRDPYDERDAARISFSILSAVAYMHQRGVCHRDLKYENIMFLSARPDADVKIIDFGLSKKYGASGKERMHDQVGTIYSMSPEVLRGNYTNKADIWSCGVITFMLLSSTMPFYGKNQKSVMRRVIAGKYEFRAPKWEKISQLAQDFVSLLMRYKATDRPSAEEATQNPWLRKQKKLRTSVETMNAVQASIQNFSNYNTLKKLALMVVAHKSTSEEIGFLRHMAKKYDINKGGVDLNGFKAALRDYEYTEQEFECIFRGVDIDNSGCINYYEFLAATIESHGYINEERLAEAFDRLDSDDSGYITVFDLQELLGSEVPKEYLDSIIDEADIVNDKRISYEEFLHMWDVEEDFVRERTVKNVALRRRTREPPKVGAFNSIANFLDSSLSSAINGDNYAEEFGQDTFHRHKLSRRVETT